MLAGERQLASLATCSDHLTPPLAQVHDGDELFLLHVFHTAALTFADVQQEKQEAVIMLQGAVESAKQTLLPPRAVEISSQLLESADVRQSLVTFCRNFDFVVVGSLGNSGGRSLLSVCTWLTSA